MDRIETTVQLGRDNNYICGIIFSYIKKPTFDALADFMNVKFYRENIRSRIVYDFNYNYYIVELHGSSITNVLCARYQVIEFLKRGWLS